MDTSPSGRTSPTLVSQVMLWSLIGLAGVAISACSSTRSGDGTQWLDVSMDGNVAEWPADASVAMDDQYAYFRLSVQNEEFTLQAAPQTVAVLLDVDGDPSTGKYLYLGKDDQGRPKKLGADLEIQFSPMNPADPAKPKKGVALFALAKDGSRTALERGTHDVVFLPTYASPWYELRVSRHLKDRAKLPQRGLFSRGATTGVFVLYGNTEKEAGQIVGYAEPFGVTSPPAPAAAPQWRPTVMDLPKKDPRELRIVSYNVLKSKPLSNPDTFKRIFDALEPDFVFLQEWQADDKVTQSWFTALVSSPTGWYVQANPAADCAIISRHALTSFGGPPPKACPTPCPCVPGRPPAPGRRALSGPLLTLHWAPWCWVPPISNAAAQRGAPKMSCASPRPNPSIDTCTVAWSLRPPRCASSAEISTWWGRARRWMCWCGNWMAPMTSPSPSQSCLVPRSNTPGMTTPPSSAQVGWIT